MCGAWPFGAPSAITLASASINCWRSTEGQRQQASSIFSAIATLTCVRCRARARLGLSTHTRGALLNRPGFDAASFCEKDGVYGQALPGRAA